MQQATDVVAGDVGQPAVAGLVVEQRVPALPQGLVGVHAGAVVASQGLRHEGGNLAVLVAGVLDDVLERLEVIRGMQERVEAVVDLVLAAGSNLVVEAFHIEADQLQVLHDRVAYLLGLVHWGVREVAALVASGVAQVRGAVEHVLVAAVPPALVGIDVVEGRVRLSGVGHLVEDEELGLHAEGRGVSDAGGGEVLLGLLRHVARVAGERLVGERVVDEELHVQRRHVAERVAVRGGGVREQDHVRLVDGGEASDGGAVERHSSLRCLFVEGRRGQGEMVLRAGDVGEADVEEFDSLVLDVLDDVVGVSESH